MGFRSSNIWNVGRVFINLDYFSHPPFYDIEPTNIYKKILNGVIEFPKFLHVRAKDVIRKLLNSDINKRLGVEDVMSLFKIGRSSINEP